MNRSHPKPGVVRGIAPRAACFVVTLIVAPAMGCGGSEPEGDGPVDALDCPRGSARVAAPVQGVALGAYPPLDDIYGPEKRKLGAYIRAAGKRPAWAVFIDYWPTPEHIRFPAERVRRLWNEGILPRIYLWPLSTGDSLAGADPVFKLQAFIDGSFDAQLRQWARDAKASGVPIMAEFGPEANGGFPWSAKYNGAGATGAYGDPELPDGAERFRDAYRHVVRVFREAGADNVTWSFHVVPEYGPSWNAIRGYYPGDDYVDWIGLSAYGTVVGQSGVQESFRTVMDRAYPQIDALSESKPLAVLEMAVDEGADPDQKGRWIEQAFADVEAGRWPRIKAALWWNQTVKLPPNPRLHFRIDSSASSLEAYRSAISSPFFRDEPTFECAHG